MAARRKGSFNVNAAIEPQVNLPLDARTHVRTKAERLDGESFNLDYIYKGMIVASRDEEGLFFLVDHNDPTKEASWKLIGPYDDAEIRRLINEVDNRISDQTITGGTGITVQKTGDNYTITNTNSSFPSDFDIKGGDNVTVQKTGNEYTITTSVGITSSDDDYMIISVTPNIIVTAVGDDEVNIFRYNVDISQATSDNNKLTMFTSGVDKIEISNTSLPKGLLSSFATSGVGIYYDSSSGDLSYNDGSNTKTIVQLVLPKTLVASDITIV